MKDTTAPPTLCFAGSPYMVPARQSGSFSGGTARSAAAARTRSSSSLERTSRVSSSRAASITAGSSS